MKTVRLLGITLVLWICLCASAQATRVKLRVKPGQDFLIANQKHTIPIKIGLTGFTMQPDKDRAAVNVALVLDPLRKRLWVPLLLLVLLAVAGIVGLGTKLALDEQRMYETQYRELIQERLDRDTLLNQCWGVHYFPNSRTLDQTIANLRKKIEIDPKQPQIIATVSGAGYRYEG